MPSDLSRKIAEAVLSMQPDPFRDPVGQTADMIERAGVGKLEDSYAKLFSENLALHKGVIGGEQQRDALAKRLAAVEALHCHLKITGLSGDYCGGCTDHWPCPTVRAARGEDR